ncbi:PD-(D/E)XK nuclease family protein [Candidatus Kaiserbacteria bacterium]|nr:PD-(D/E)XK nuclease family protein [Candidatus Kaiserbacteria bacterium]
MPRGYVRRTRGLYNPKDGEPFRISRSKIDLFLECPRCFWLDQRLGVKRPEWPAFSLNNAVDELLKREFDIHRAKGEPHPLMKTYKVDAIPLKDPRMDEWRDAMRRGVQFHHARTNLILRGGVDDVWVTPQNELVVVDYKATSKKEEVSLDGYWQQAYKRQVEVYQWLLRKNGLTVSDTAYFVYVNAKSDVAAFDGRLEFDVRLLSYKGDDSWIEPTILKLAECLRSESIPERSKTCEYCGYREEAGKELQARVKRETKSLGI